MSSPIPPSPVEEWLADRLSTKRPDGGPPRAVRVLRRIGRLDRAAYEAVAEMPTPQLDSPLRRISDFANFSKPWLLVAGGLALFGGAHGRRAALTGLAAIGLTSFVINQPMKLAGNRRRPGRTRLGVPESRWIRMPSSTSFPSGHSASAAAFAASVGRVLPGLRLPLRAVAVLVAFSRVYTGVHYPGDVVVGAIIGSLLGRATAAVALRRRPESCPFSRAFKRETGQAPSAWRLGQQSSP
jgi:membrane-associated phospholipid phosphatase